MKTYTLLRVLATTHTHLKALAAHQQQPMTDVLDALVKEAYTAVIETGEPDTKEDA
jgi:hypothetical protein